MDPNLYSSILLLLVILLQILGQLVQCTTAKENMIEVVTPRNQLLLNWKPPQSFRKRFPYYLSGYDRDGDPVFVAEPGKWDMRSFLESADEETKKDFDTYFEQLGLVLTHPEMVSPQVPGDPPPEKFVMIWDVEGYDIRQVAHALTIEKYLFIIRKFVENLRLRKINVKKGFFVNANFVFQTVWNLMKPIFGDTIAFMELYGTKSRYWIPKILEYVPKNQLPSSLGGHKGHKVMRAYG